MADLRNADSTYATSGAADTHTDLINAVDDVDADFLNRPTSGVLAIQAVLGDGTVLPGTQADLATRLAVALETNGKLKDFSATTKTTFPPALGEGGTAATSFTGDHVVIVNAGATALTGEATLAVSRGGTNSTDYTKGLALTVGPTSVGSGSTRTHEGSTTISSPTNLGGIHYYTDFTLNASTTVTIPDGDRRLIIIAKDSITINGTITGAGAGASSVAQGSKGNSGTDQPGGGGGDGADEGNTNGEGGDVVHHSIVIQTGGNNPDDGVGGAGTQLTGSDMMFGVFDRYGGASGGGAPTNGTAGDGGAGGASIVLIAPTITLGAASTLNTSGDNGENGAGIGSGHSGGGGGGAGNIYMICTSYTDNGATFTQTGGSGGSATGTGNAGGAGANGTRQILIYS